MTRLNGLLILVALPVFAACGGGSSGDTTPPAPLIVSINDGNSQTAVVGKAVTTSPSVLVTTNGAATAGVTVTFSIAGGAGSVAAGSATTNSSGIARVGSWTLGTTAGANALTASISGNSSGPVTFTATGVAGPAAAFSKVAGDGGSGAAGTALSVKPSVKLADSFGNGVSGIPVTFAAASGGGSVIGASATTANDGTATVGGWTLGSAIGPNTLSATAVVTGLPQSTLTFTATALSGPVATITKVAGDNQSGLVSAALPIAPSVKLADAFGNLVANQTVTFSITGGGGSVTGATPASNSSGVATVGSWTLGPNLGANELTATAGTVLVRFAATAASPFNAAQYAGTYTGPWTNSTFGSTGVGTAVISVSGSAATVTVNVTGNVLGVGGVSNAQRSGNFTSSGASFTGNVSPMGDITATIDAAGHIVASGVNVPNSSISRWDATGTITPTQLQMSYTVTFTSGSTALGTIALTKL